MKQKQLTKRMVPTMQDLNTIISATERIQRQLESIVLDNAADMLDALDDAGGQRTSGVTRRYGMLRGAVQARNVVLGDSGYTESRTAGVAHDAMMVYHYSYNEVIQPETTAEIRKHIRSLEADMRAGR